MLVLRSAQLNSHDISCLRRSDLFAVRARFDPEFIPHRLHLIAEVVVVEHPGASLRLAASDRGEPFILFSQSDFHFNFLQFDFGHLCDFQPETTKTIRRIATVRRGGARRMGNLSESPETRVANKVRIWSHGPPLRNQACCTRRTSSCEASGSNTCGKLFVRSHILNSNPMSLDFFRRFQKNSELDLVG